MKILSYRLALLALSALAPIAAHGEDLIDQIDNYLAVSAFHGNVRAKLSGLIDMEGYALQQPSPGLIYTDDDFLFNPRLTLFVDVQVWSYVYAFAQARVDRGFDPSESDAEVRLDEFAIRISPWADGRFSLQAGQFATVIGNWVARHDSWDNPFITAPLPYENLTGIWDTSAPFDVDSLLWWGHAGAYDSGDYSDKYLRNPIIWGPSYASGISVAGKLGKFDYAAEMKNSSLSARPESWSVTKIGFEYPTFSGRIGFHPNPMWNLGVSASSGAYLLPEAELSLPPGTNLGDYREQVLAQDLSFEWHHLQLWAEFFETRFEVPRVGNADTFAYYLEAKYKFTPQFYGALRWNQQFYGTVADEEEQVAWGNDIDSFQVAIGYRFTPHTQLKLQYSIANEESKLRDLTQMFAGQLTLKF